MYFPCIRNRMIVSREKFVDVHLSKVYTFLHKNDSINFWLLKYYAGVASIGCTRSVCRRTVAPLDSAAPPLDSALPPLDSASLHLAVCCRQILIGVKTASILSAGCLHTIERSPLSCKHVGGSFLLYDICCADAVFTVTCLARYHSHSMVATGLGDRS